MLCQDEASSGKRSKVQLLYQLAQSTLSTGRRATEEQIDTLSLAMSSVPLSELCLDQSEHCQLPEPNRPKAIGHHMAQQTDEEAGEQLRVHGRHAPILSWRRPPITYLHIFEDETMSLGVFLMPALSQIPLHDHPGMTVFTRVLYGQLHYMAFDWVDTMQRGDYDQPEPARLVTDRTFRASDDPIVLFPRAGGNLHQLTALTDCAIISLLCPPYNAGQGRDCHYYRVFETREEELDARTVLLEECDPPRDFYIGCGKYRGALPRVRPRSPITMLPAQARHGSPAADSPSSSHVSTSCNLAAAAAAAAVHAAAATRGAPPMVTAMHHRTQPMPDTIPIPHMWL